MIRAGYRRISDGEVTGEEPGGVLFELAVTPHPEVVDTGYHHDLGARSERGGEGTERVGRTYVIAVAGHQQHRAGISGERGARVA